MQFRVPQNLTLEDRIAGPLTAIQFGIVVLGGGMAFIVYSSIHLPSPFNSVLALFLAILTATMAIGKFNDQPLYRFIKFIFVFLFSPRTRIWRKGGGEVQLIKPTSTSTTPEQKPMIKKLSKEELTNLALVLDSRGASGLSPRPGSTPPAPTKPAS